jgi:hypothetical protein
LKEELLHPRFFRLEEGALISANDNQRLKSGGQAEEFRYKEQASRVLMSIVTHGFIWPQLTAGTTYTCDELINTSTYLPNDSDEPPPIRELRNVNISAATGKSNSLLV